MHRGLIKAKFYIPVFILVLAMVFVYAEKKNKVSYLPPEGFEKETNLAPGLLPTVFYSKEGKEVSIYIPPSFKLKNGAPKTASGKIEPDFLIGKKSFNSQFGILDWKMDSYNFKAFENAERLEITGSYTSGKGTKNSFIEHHYFSKRNQAQSIQIIYPEDANPVRVKSAKLSLENFNPGF